MESSRNYENFSYAEFRDLIRGALRSTYKYKKHYNLGQNQTNEITLENCWIEADSEGRIELSQMVSPLILIFINCKIPPLVVRGNLNALKLVDCEVPELSVENDITIKLEISGTRSKTGNVKAKQGHVYNFSSDGYIHEIELYGAEESGTITTDFKGSIGRLTIDSVRSLAFNCTAKIDECYVINSMFFPKNPTIIKSLFLKQAYDSLLVLSGLFETVHLETINSSLLFRDFTCLGDLTIIDQPNLSGDGRYTELQNVYIGGKFLATKCDVVFIARLDDVTNKYLLINELEIGQSLRGLEFKTSKWELAININKLTFIDIHFGKDVFWTIQGLLCYEITFSYFRNAGFGNISTTYGGQFKPITAPFNNVLKNNYLSGTLHKDIEGEKLIDYNLSGKGGVLTVNYSDMGRINFIDDDFADFTLNFNSTKLSEIYLAGSRLPKIVKASELGDLPENQRHQERIANAQLKKLHEQHGDILAANEYFANEMNAYYHSMIWKNHFWEKLPLAFNKYTSNHGQSWIRALICTFLVSFLFYCLFVNCMGYHPASFLQSTNWKTFLLIASLYLNFLNPIHKLDDFQSLYTNHGFDPALRFIDGIGRIFVAYCVYQLIQAFRKHGRTK